MASATDRAEHRLKSSSIGPRRLLVVDDHAIVQMGLRALLGQQDWVQRCLSATNSAEALALAVRYEPHIALVDVIIGVESGVELCRAMRQQVPHVNVLLMSGGGSVSPAVARAAGAIGFVSKSWAPAMLVEAVHRAACNKLVFEPRSSQTSLLTEREMDVLREIAAGASNPETAKILHLSPHTVKQHTSSLYRKLHARNRTDAVRCAQRLGLIS